MKLLECVFVVLLWQTKQVFAQLKNEQPVAVLKASADDPRTPLILLSNSVVKTTLGASIKPEQDIETTLTPDAATTTPPVTDESASIVKPNKKTRPPQKQKPAFGNGIKPKLPYQSLLLMPGLGDSFPKFPSFPSTTVDAFSVQPVFYPMPVYIPYPIPFMLNQQMHLMSRPSKDKVEDQIAMSFNEMMSEKLLRSSFQLDNGSEWQETTKNRIKPANQNGIKKWRGKWRMTTTSTTTTTTEAPVPSPTEPTRLLMNSSNQSDSEVKSPETSPNNETTQAAR
ncbi:uncharacterized protein LOC108091721 [Drosophila ficusphila]|uniref:uncharacterized protein LOC108091721 n=1 Tax=Drosophila ficusphila TaxID=30025 RepID=UPI0007E89025|nr:uncharacterized protein LOC108091721 [Drosophila ficusphila]